MVDECNQGYTRWGPSVDISGGTPSTSTSTSSNTYKNLEMEKEAKEIDEELKKMVLKGAKHRVNLDLI